MDLNIENYNEIKLFNILKIENIDIEINILQEIVMNKIEN